MKLLTEFFQLCENGVCQDFLNEEEKVLVKNGSVILTGILQRADTKNGNGRIYPRAILDREFERYSELVKARRAAGTVDHPASESVLLSDASHIIREMWWEGNDLMGKVEVLTTPKGQIVRALINDGIPLGISSRGLGSVREAKDAVIVEDDFKLICFDLVWEPSVQGAFQRPVNESLNESLKFDGVHKLLNDILKK